MDRVGKATAEIGNGYTELPDTSRSAMSIDPAELASLQADFQRVTGRACPDFYCPVMHEFGCGPEGLMNGHILPQSVKYASRATVIQRHDVDNSFSQIEGVLCSFLNLPYDELNEIFNKSKGLTVTGSSGSPAPAFFASKKATPPFPQVGLLDKKGEIIAKPFVRTQMDQANTFDGPVDVEGELIFSASALVASLIKSAYLALYRLAGYEWVFNPAGQYIAKRLAKLVQHDVSAERVVELAYELSNCFKMVPGPAASEDTIASRILLFHYNYYDGPGHPTQYGKYAWGVSCIFKMNETSFTVTLPFSFCPDGLEDALKQYRYYLNEPSVKHSAYEGEVRSDGQMQHSMIGTTITMAIR